MKLDVLPQVQIDVDEIWLYVARKSGSIDLADRFVDRITDQFHLIVSQPFLGRIRPEFGGDLRSIAVGEYVILYRIRADEVRICRVLRGSRDIEGLMTE